MTALQLNADIYRSLGIISEDENVLRRVLKYLTRVAKTYWVDIKDLRNGSSRNCYCCLWSL